MNAWLRVRLGSLVVIAKLPKASVQLAATLVADTRLGSNPPMIFHLVGSGSLTSLIVIRVALPKPVIELSPLNVGLVVVTSGVPSAAIPVELTWTVLGKVKGARLMAKEPRP